MSSEQCFNLWLMTAILKACGEARLVPFPPVLSSAATPGWGKSIKQGLLLL